MSKAVKIKTQQTTANVEDFVNKVDNEQQHADSFAIIEMMKRISGEEPKMWGTSIIGFGNKKYRSPKTGREVDWFLIGFSPRKANISLYLDIDINKHEDTLQKLGKFKTGVGCLYINKLTDIDQKQLEKLIKTALQNK
ncbi:MAG: DUF1801 domain-containing protein [Ignavibacterium album]|jgi:hypothetical protein|uniref:DUF1801 domain-containing protein n=1 Tax=Ignavibacterium album TaxID=591197 RepID=UPI0026ED254C|nr:DUF1801 domain-containing protein [Ignavibacterium album]MBI5661737.1 DUF1801 domain-containing protein [Ignavibacterium album]